MESADLAQLAALDALLQEGSVTGAARRLGLSTPAVSHALARLRTRFDDPLLVRAGRAMVRTPRAEALRPRVRDALASAARVFEPPDDFDPARLDRTFVTSATDYVLHVLGEALDGRLRDAAPEVDLRFVLNASDDAERLRRGDTDLAIGIYAALPPELKTRRVLRERLVCALRERHPDAARLTLDAFVRLSHVQVAPRGQPGGPVDRLLAARGLERRVARAVPFFRQALELVARTDHVLTIPERIGRALAPELGLAIVEPPLPLAPYALHAVWHPRLDGDAGHRWLRGQLFAAAGALQPRHGTEPGATRRRRPRRGGTAR